MGFFSELRERRLFQIVAAYLAAGWVGIEVINTQVERGLLPDLAYNLALVWFLAGIPAAFLVGWHHGEKGKQKAPISEVVVLLVLAVSVVGFSGVSVADYVAQRSAIMAARESALDLDRIAVLYFDDRTPGRELQHVADGLTESLIEELSAVRSLDVISRNGVGQFRGSEVRPDSVARVLQAGTIVEGDIERVGDRLRVNVALLEGQTGAPYGGRASFERPADDLMAVREELAREVSRQLRAGMGREVQLRRARTGTSDQAAWVLYLRAERARKDGEDALVRHDDEAAREAFARADSLSRQVELLDPAWAAPAILRAELEYRRARLAHDRHQRVEHAQRGRAEIAPVLEAEPTHARALGLRGTLRYFEYLQNMIPDEDEAAALRQQARVDFEAAVRLDPTLADVWSGLAHMYYGESITDAVMAGERAYEEDAYLDAANVVLWRLYTSHYDDLGNFNKAVRFCNEGARRFPEDDRFVSCQLELMHTPAVAPDPDRAWELAARIDSLAAPQRKEFARVQTRIFVAGALARASMPDSARAVLDRAVAAIDPHFDPELELLTVAAAMMSMLGDDDRAIDLLKRHRTARPNASFEHHWWYRSIRSHPRYPEIAARDH